jgi:aspartyl-tRNA(Asn)/glutamyl-tRNA(Gln) amidotransferase subunit A
LAAVKTALEGLEQLGASIRTVDLPDPEPIAEAWNCICLAEAYAYHEVLVKTRAADYGNHLLSRLRAGALYPASDYIRAQRMRAKVSEEFRGLMTEVDVIVTPTSMTPAPLLDEYDPLKPFTPNFTQVFNMTGMPAISINCGFTGGGLPIGLQIAGRAFDEETVLSVANAYERNTKWHEVRPDVLGESVAGEGESRSTRRGKP